MPGIKQKIKSSKLLMNAFYWLRFYAHGNRYKAKGKGNRIVFTGALLKHNTFVVNGDNNIISIGDSSHLSHCKISVQGSHHNLIIGEKGSVNETNIAFEDHHGSITIGDNFSMYKGGEIAAVEPHSKIEIGDDCMFSVYVDIRNTDSHSIIDTASGRRINPGKNIKIGNKVWIGAYVQILKGITIGDNSIVGIRSLVNKDVPPSTLVGGVPARVLKTGVDWQRERI